MDERDLTWDEIVMLGIVVYHEHEDAKLSNQANSANGRTCIQTSVHSDSAQRLRKELIRRGVLK